MNKQKVDDLMCAFRQVHGQLQTSVNTTFKDPHKKERKNVTSQKYSNFLKKYNDVENTFETFGTQDLVYYFREKANEAGIKYVIANFQRDMGIFKRVRSNFEVSEILLMIEFIFSSEQDYLDIHRTQPTVLTSNWVNTIYKDSLDWANDCYTPHKNKKSDRLSKREWNKTTSKEKSKIGEW